MTKIFDVIRKPLLTEKGYGEVEEPARVLLVRSDRHAVEDVRERDAEQQGCRTLDGLGMLVNQGVIGFRIWTGIDPDPEMVKKYRVG